MPRDNRASGGSDDIQYSVYLLNILYTVFYNTVYINNILY